MAKHKYHAVSTVVDGHTFPSKKEARRFAELKLLEKAGEIKDLRLQPEYPLTVLGERLGCYRADFTYLDLRTKRVVIEDVKGGEATKTPLWRWKIKHLRAQYGIQVVEV